MTDRLVTSGWVRQARAESGLSQAGLARAIGVSQRQRIEHIEGGRAAGLSDIVRIARVTDYDPWSVLESAGMLDPDVLEYLARTAPAYLARIEGGQ